MGFCAFVGISVINMYCKWLQLKSISLFSLYKNGGINHETQRLDSIGMLFHHMAHDLIVQAAFLSDINVFASPKRLKLKMFSILLMDRSSGIRSEKSILLISIYIWV